MTNIVKQFKSGILVRFIKKRNQNHTLPIVQKNEKGWSHYDVNGDKWKEIEYGSLGLIIEPYTLFDSKFVEHIVLFDGTLTLAWFDDLKEVE